MSEQEDKKKDQGSSLEAHQGATTPSDLKPIKNESVLSDEAKKEHSNSQLPQTIDSRSRNGAPLESPEEEKPSGKRRRRGPLYGASWVLGISFGIFLVPYLLIQGLLLFGVIHSVINSDLQEQFGDRAKIKEVDVSGLSSFSAQEIYIPSKLDSNEEVFSAASVQVDWDLWPLLSQGNIRRIWIDKPVIKLKRDASGAWNFALKKREESGGEIAQYLVSDGSFLFEWQPGRSLRWDQLQASYLRPESPFPKSASLSGRWPSGRTIALEAFIQPDRTIAASLNGEIDLGVDLQKALPEAWPVEGVLSFEGRVRPVSGFADSSGNASAKETGISFSLRSEKILAGIWNKKTHPFPLHHLSLKLITRMPFPTPSDDPVRIRKLKLTADDLFTFECARLESRPAGIKLSGASLRIDLAELQKGLDGLFDLASLQAHGKWAVKDVEGMVPWSGDLLQSSLTGTLDARDVHVSFPGLEDLPHVSLQAGLVFEKKTLHVSKALFALPPVGEIQLSGVVPFGKNGIDFKGALQSLALEKLDVDLEGLAGTSIGRKLLSGRVNEMLSETSTKRGPPRFSFGGKLHADGFNVVKQEKTDDEVISWRGVKLSGFKLLRWPYSLPVPDLTISSDFGANIKLTKGKVAGVELEADLSCLTEIPIRTKVTLSAKADAQGALKPRQIVLDKLALPVSEILRQSGSPGGLHGGGIITVSDVALDLHEKTFRGALELKDVAVSYGQLAILGMNNLNGAAQITVSPKLTKIVGKLKSGNANYFSKLYGGLPAGDFELRVEAGGKEGAEPWFQSFSMKLNWGRKRFFHVSGKILKREDAYDVQAGIKSSILNGLNATVSFLVDPEMKKVRSLTVRATDVNLERLCGLWPNRWAARSGRVSGQAEELLFELGTFSIRNLSSLFEQKWEGVVSGRVKGVSFRHVPSGSEAEHLNGTFRATLSAYDRFKKIAMNALFSFDRYEMLLNRRIYIPPPVGKETTQVHVVGSVQDFVKGGWSARLDRFTFDVPGLLDFQASGRFQSDSKLNTLDAADGFVEVKAQFPDLARIQKEWGIPNFAYRHPRWAAAKVQGGASFTGRYVWGIEKKALNGRLLFRDVGLEVGGLRKISIQHLNASLPLLYHQSDSLWPGDWPQKVEGSMNFERASFDPVSLKKHSLRFKGIPNRLDLADALDVDLPGGRVTVTDLSVRQLLSSEPALRFGLKVPGVSLAALAQAEGWNIKGLAKGRKRKEALLSGELKNCSLIRKAGLIGSWALETKGELNAPFFQGNMRIGGFHGRGLFGAAPVWGAWLKINGLNFGQFTRMNPRFGRLKTVANISLTNLSLVGIRLEDVQTFRLDLDRVSRAKNDDEYDGRLALLVARPMVEAALKRLNASENWVVGKRFGIRDLGLTFDLKAGELIGPKGKLKNGYILLGRGMLSKDIEGAPDARTLWSDCVLRIRAHEKQVKTLPADQPQKKD